MSEQKNGQRLDELMEGFLEYLADVGRKKPRTVIDVRCTLKQVTDAMRTLAPKTDLWKLKLNGFPTLGRAGTPVGPHERQYQQAVEPPAEFPKLCVAHATRRFCCGTRHRGVQCR